MIKFGAKLHSMPPARPGRVALVLRVVNLAVLRQVRRQPECSVRVDGVREPNVRGTRGHVLDGALREGLAAGKLEKTFAIAHTALCYEIGRPSMRKVPAVLSVLRRHCHKRTAGYC